MPLPNLGVDTSWAKYTTQEGFWWLVQHEGSLRDPLTHLPLVLPQLSINHVQPVQMEWAPCLPPSSRWASELPDIAAMKIFNLLGQQEAAVARLVCSAWASAVPRHRRCLKVIADVETLRSGLPVLRKFSFLSQLHLRCTSIKMSKTEDGWPGNLQPIADTLKVLNSTTAIDLDLTGTGWLLSSDNLASLGVLHGLTSLSIGNSGVHGQDVLALRGLSRLTSLDMSGCHAGPSTLELLAASVPQLTHLDWSSNFWYRDSNGAKEQLQNWTGSLTWLSLANCSLSDDGLAALEVLPSLLYLDLSVLPTAGTSTSGAHNTSWLNDEGMSHLTSLVRLKELRIQNQIELTCEGLCCLSKLEALSALDLSGCVSLLDNGDLDCIGRLSSLERLSLQAVNNNITCPSTPGLLEPLRMLRKLQYLDLSGNWETLSVDGLAPLAELPNLTYLDITPGPSGFQMGTMCEDGAYSSEELACLALQLSSLLTRCRVSQQHHPL